MCVVLQVGYIMPIISQDAFSFLQHIPKVADIDSMMKGELGVLVVHFRLGSFPESKTFSISNQIKPVLFGIMISGDMDH